MTKTGGRLPVEEPDELGALALRQPPTVFDWLIRH